MKIFGASILVVVLVFSFISVSLSQSDIDPKVYDLITKMENSIFAFKDYTCTISSEVRKGRVVEKNRCRFYYKKPELLRLDVVEGKKRGSIVLMNDKGKIRGKGAFGIVVTLKPESNLLKNVRGHTFLQASYHAILNNMKRKLKSAREVSVEDATIVGKSAYLVRIEYDPPFERISKERIWIDKDSYAVLKLLKYEGELVVEESVFNEIQINAGVDSDLFIM